MAEGLPEGRSGKVEHRGVVGIYSFAGHTIEISTSYPYVHAMCRAYQTEERAERSLSVGQRDIDDERRRSGSEDPAAFGSDAYLETLAVYRKIAESLLDDGVLLFHGSAVAVDGMGYLFAGKSGAGKSTHARLWRELLGQRAVMVNDDKPLLEIADGSVTVWGTPWDGKHHLSRNISVPLRAVCFLEQGETNATREAWPLLWRQSYRPADPEKLRRTLALTDVLARSARLYRLRCTPDVRAARVAFEAMSKGEGQ